MKHGVYIMGGAIGGVVISAVLSFSFFTYWAPEMAFQRMIKIERESMQATAATAPIPGRPNLNVDTVMMISPKMMAEISAGKLPPGWTQQDVASISILIAQHEMAKRKATMLADRYARATVNGVPVGPDLTPAQIDAKLAAENKPSFEPPLPDPDGPVVLRADPETGATEGDWIGHEIMVDIFDQVIAGLHLDQPIDKLHFTVTVSENDLKPRVMLSMISNWKDDPTLAQKRFSTELPIEFAWDAAGYSVPAEYVIGSHALPPSVPDKDADGLLNRLLNLTGPVLATEDVRVSALLTKNPLDATAQGEAALLLAGMAWRENAGLFSDNRDLLCKATAHLALARAVDSLNHQQPDWNAQVADIALRVLAGREADALQRIDQLSAATDAPGAAKTWLSALRVWSKGDWRDASVDQNLPLLTKLAWFQVLNRDLSDLPAMAKLDKTGDLAKVPDWGRILLNQPGFSVDTGNRFAQATLGLELQEAVEVAKAENQPAADKAALVEALKSPRDATVTADTSGKMTIRVIGRGTFLAGTRRHLFNTILKTDKWLREMLGVPEEAAQFETSMTTAFGNLPFFELVTHRFPNPDKTQPPMLIKVLREKDVVWNLRDVPEGVAFDDFFYDSADTQVLNDFYLDGEPLGTAYDLPLRMTMLTNLRVDPRWHISNYAPSAKDRFEVKRNYLAQLQKLQPDSAFLAEQLVQWNHDVNGGETGAEALATLKPYMDYDETPYNILLAKQPGFSFSNSDLETIYNKEASLEPDTYFALGKLLRDEGRADDAAEADRKGVAQAYDQVGVANSIEPLVEYDEAHGKMDEALALAKRASDDVGSGNGMWTYGKVLEKLNRLDEAEATLKDLKDRYDAGQPLINLYLAHRDHFRKQVEAVTQDTFPQGQASVSLTSFSGPPETGAVFSSYSQGLTDAGLNENDVVVALNSTKVENMKQYDFVRGSLVGNDMDLIVWHQGQYEEIHASPPQHMFGADMSDYPKQ